MDYKKRRLNLYNLMDENSVFIFFNKRPYEDASMYDCDRNFYYLTGINEFDDILVVKKTDKLEEFLYIQRINPQQEKWTGKVLRPNEAEEISNINDIRYIDQFDNDLEKLLDNTTKVYTLYKDGPEISYSYEELFRNKLITDYKMTQVNGNTLLMKLRKVKDDEEIELIKKANAITNIGIKNILSNLKPGLYEYQLESFFDQAIKFNGATGHAFPTICAGGINATCLHYNVNNSILNDNELVLLDLGSSCKTYCSDISRTFPINGKFSDRQKLVYNIVLKGQKLIESVAKPGYTTKELNQILIKYFQKELKKIGLIDKDEDVIKYYFHGVSHHMGMDCHDFCTYDALTKGCVISNEPGLYIPEWNIGIRIEDDLLITEDGCINLSKDIIKEIDDIEAFMSKQCA